MELHKTVQFNIRWKVGFSDTRLHLLPAYSYAWHLFAARHGVLAADCGALDSVTDTVPLDLTRFMPPHLLDEVC